MKILFNVLISKEMEIEVPDSWMPYAKAYFTDDEERTDEQWDLVEAHGWDELIDAFLPDGESEYAHEICEVIEE